MRLRGRHLALALILGAGTVLGGLGPHSQSTTAPTGHFLAGSSNPPPPDPFSIVRHP